MNDLERVYDVARAIGDEVRVCRRGIGLKEGIFSEPIDVGVKNIASLGKKRAMNILMGNLRLLKDVAELLLEKRQFRGRTCGDWRKVCEYVNEYG